jgi:hypothetical protein
VLIPRETDFLVPNTTFVVELMVALTIFAVLVIWPLVDTVARRQWGWTLFVVILGPLAGFCWWTFGKRSTQAPA